MRSIAALLLPKYQNILWTNTLKLLRIPNSIERRDIINQQRGVKLTHYRVYYEKPRVHTEIKTIVRETSYDDIGNTIKTSVKTSYAPVDGSKFLNWNEREINIRKNLQGDVIGYGEVHNYSNKVTYWHDYYLPENTTYKTLRWQHCQLIFVSGVFGTWQLLQRLTSVIAIALLHVIFAVIPNAIYSTVCKRLKAIKDLCQYRVDSYQRPLGFIQNNARFWSEVIKRSDVIKVSMLTRWCYEARDLWYECEKKWGNLQDFTLMKPKKSIPKGVRHTWASLVSCVNYTLYQLCALCASFVLTWMLPLASFIGVFAPMYGVVLFGALEKMLAEGVFTYYGSGSDDNSVMTVESFPKQDRALIVPNYQCRVDMFEHHSQQQPIVVGETAEIGLF